MFFCINIIIFVAFLGNILYNYLRYYEGRQMQNLNQLTATKILNATTVNHGIKLVCAFGSINI